MLDTRWLTKLSLIGRTFAGLTICIPVAFAVTMVLFTRSEAERLQLETGQEKQPPVTAPARPAPSDNAPQRPAAVTDVSAASVPIETPQNEPPLTTVPLRLENESQFPIAVIEASIEISKLVSSRTGGINRVITSRTMKEQPKDGTFRFFDVTGKKQTDDKTGGSSSPLYDAVKASQPFPNLIRDLKYTVKIINKGAQPITRLELEILNPVLFQGERVPLRRIWGKVSDGLGANEVYTFSGIHSIGDKSDDENLDDLEMALLNNTPLSNENIDINTLNGRLRLEIALLNNMLRSQPKIESEEISPSLKPTILRKEKAEYTPEARAKGVEGTVVLSVVFPAHFPIPRVLRVIRGLPYGLSSEAVSAALRMRFHPAMKDGVPVNVRGNVEFDFKLNQ
jgi:Gram-negative bacterial TonB protein C-terminal